MIRIEQQNLAGFWEDGEKAIVENPRYFLYWYSAKSWLLVASLATLAYQAGRRSR